MSTSTKVNVSGAKTDNIKDETFKKKSTRTRKHKFFEAPEKELDDSRKAL